MNSKCSVEQMIQLWAYLDHTAFAINKAREKEVRKYGLSMVQNKVIVILKLLDHEPTLGELSRWLFREHTSVANITNKMEVKGLIRKYRDPLKKNSTRVVLTEKGKQAYPKIVKRESVINILSVLSPEECEQINSSLIKLYKRALVEINTKNGISLPTVWNLVRKEYVKGGSLQDESQPPG